VRSAMSAVARCCASQRSWYSSMNARRRST
jgi:hypothetical protein